MTSDTRNVVLTVLLVLISAVAVVVMYRMPSRDPVRMPSKDPVLMWDGSAGATHYEVQIDGTLLGTFTETRAPLPTGFEASEHRIEVRACTGESCSEWQTLANR